jgi:hypothetical protein
MTEQKPVARRSDDEMDAGLRWLRERAAYFRNNGDRLTAMPWTRDLFSEDELWNWLASREEAARTIDVATCEIAWWYACECDPYGIYEELDELDPDGVGRQRYVRGPHSRGWVCTYHLSDEQRKSLDERMRRQGKH